MRHVAQNEDSNFTKCHIRFSVLRVTERRRWSSPVLPPTGVNMSLRTCQLAICATLALILALGACDGMVPGGGDVEQAVEQERASALARGVGGAGGSGSFDSLTTYTARCEAATGIHVPTSTAPRGSRSHRARPSPRSRGRRARGSPP